MTRDTAGTPPALRRSSAIRPRLDTVRGVVVGFAVALAASALTAPAGAVTTAPMAYKSCSYPKSNAKPVIKINARSWTQQGFDAQVRGIDVSMWQHPRSVAYPKGKPINFLALKQKYGLQFAFLKGSDGGNRDKGKSKYWFRKDRAAAVRQGIIVGAYHYAVPGQAGTGVMTLPKGQSSDATLRQEAARNRAADARLQAHQAVTQALGNPVGDLPITLDFEERPCGWTWRQTGVWARDFLVEVERITGRQPMIYANSYFLRKLEAAHVPGIDFTRYHLWVAMWGPSLGPTPKPVPVWGSAWTFWQFTSNGSLRGVPVTNTDLDVFHGTSADLRSLAGS